MPAAPPAAARSARGGVVVVGAGVAGLAVAGRLARGGERVTLVDRLPVPGGVLGDGHPAVRRLFAACRDVALELGMTALRWTGEGVTIAGPRGVREVPARHLVYAGGTRPSTPAELRLAGARPAGVLPAPVAIHLVEAGAVLGRRVAVLGEGAWASAAVAALEHQGASEVCRVPVPEPGSPLLLRGCVRVDALGDGACDCVVLAARERPLRNVDGAVLDGAAGVSFVQPVALTAEEAEARARVFRLVTAG
jgi:NADPH-dependent glutamate synthase beta subunit-like oxidoreductase